MKIVICGDSHLGAVYGLGGPNGKGGNTRIDDYERTLNWIVDHCISNSVDVFIQTGDAFDSRSPNAEEISVMNRALKRLSMANITSAVIMGNHDYVRSGNGYSSSISSLAAKDYPNVRLVVDPQVLKVYDRAGDHTSILLMPYRDRRMYSNKNNVEDSKAFDEEVIRLSEQCTGPSIMVGHNFFFEGSYNDYGQTEVLANWEKYTRFDLIAMGHYHQSKLLNKKSPTVIYTGSMEKLNFGDQNVQKFVFEYETKTKSLKPIKTPVVEICDIVSDLSESGLEDIEDNIRKTISSIDVANKIVRAKFRVRSTVAGSLKQSFVKNLLYNANARYVSKVMFETVHVRLQRNIQSLNEGTDIEIFTKFVNGQEILQDLRSSIIDVAKEVFDEQLS